MQTHSTHERENPKHFSASLLPCIASLGLADLLSKFLITAEDRLALSISVCLPNCRCASLFFDLLCSSLSSKPVSLLESVTLGIRAINIFQQSKHLWAAADPYPLYTYLVKELNKFNLLYVHMVEPRIGKQMNVIEVDESDKSLKPFKQASNATFLAAGG